VFCRRLKSDRPSAPMATISPSSTVAAGNGQCGRDEASKESLAGDRFAALWLFPSARQKFVEGRDNQWAFIVK
jgi:hypothetical protein